MQALNVKHDLGESLPTEFVLERNEYQNGYKHTASVSKDFFIPSWWPIARCAHFGTPHPDKIDLPWNPEERMSKKDFMIYAEQIFPFQKGYIEEGTANQHYSVFLSYG